MIFRPGGRGVVSTIPVFDGSALNAAVAEPAPPAAGFFAADALGGGSGLNVGGGGGSALEMGGSTRPVSTEVCGARSIVGERAFFCARYANPPPRTTATGKSTKAITLARDLFSIGGGAGADAPPGCGFAVSASPAATGAS